MHGNYKDLKKCFNLSISIYFKIDLKWFNNEITFNNKNYNICNKISSVYIFIIITYKIN